MKSLLNNAAASLALASLTFIAAPAMAGPGHVGFRVVNDYDAQPVYVQPRVVYAPAPTVYRYRDDAGWREHAWRERERREHFWRERQWREHPWREHRNEVEHDYRGGWR